MPLVYQQAAVIRANCGIKVVELSGEKFSIKKFSADLWETAYETTDVVVLTAQILLDLLRHGFIQISRVCPALESFSFACSSYARLANLDL